MQKRVHYCTCVAATGTLTFGITGLLNALVKKVKRVQMLYPNGDSLRGRNSSVTNTERFLIRSCHKPS